MWVMLVAPWSGKESPNEIVLFAMLYPGGYFVSQDWRGPGPVIEALTMIPAESVMQKVDIDD